MVEEHRITLQLAEVLAVDQLHLCQALDLELPEQYSTFQVVGLRLILALQMVAVGGEGILTNHQLALVALAAAAAAQEKPEDQAI